MAIRNKLYYSELILNEVYPVRSRDEKIDPREVIIVMDSVANQLAKQGLLEFWQMGNTANVDEHWLTTFEPISLTDPPFQPSYVTIPATYMSLPNVQGIPRVWFTNTSGTKKKYFDPVIIMQARDVENYRNTLGGDLEGRLGCYPKSGILYFTQAQVGATYGTIGIQLLIRDSSAISDDGLYPIDPSMENEFIRQCVEWFRVRRGQPLDLVKDNNDKP